MERSKFNMLMVMTMVVASMSFFHGSMAKELVVGDSFGWALPSSESFYHWWASQQTFEPNDVLVFNFVTGAHNVAVVSRTAYQICNGSQPTSLYTTSPARITIDPNVDQFFISTAKSDCMKFMKLSL